MQKATTEKSDVGELVRRLETDFISGTTTHSKYVERNMSEDINKIYAYLDSKHTSGDTDALGREKPFFNICIGARNIRFRATDIDRKNIKIRATKGADTTASFLATVHLQDWMRRENFGAFLNTWGLELANFNECVVKFVESGGELHKMVVPWNRLIVDPINFKANPKIELLELTEAELYQRKGYDKKIVEKLCDALTTRETTEGQKKDNKNNYIKLYEVHGNLPLSYLTGKKRDEDTFVQQMHVITFIEGKDEGEFDDFTLVSGREAKDPYMLTALIPETDGSIAFNGTVKTLFEAQWMQNHNVKAIKDQLDLASKLIFQTSDGNFVGQNALSAIENGDILIHALNQPLTQVANSSHDITSLQAFGNQWKVIGNEIAGISESMLGNTAPSGTAWRQVEALLQENHSLFALMTENKGLDIEVMLREHILPFLKKKMDTSKEVSATLESHDITKIDAKYIKNVATKRTNRALGEKLLRDESLEPEDQADFMQGNVTALQDHLSSQGNQRFFKPSEITDVTWKEIFKDLEWEVEIDVTGEAFDKDQLTTLTTIFQTIANPVTAQVLQTPEGKMIFNKILSLSGAVSPLEISSLPSPIQQMPSQIGGSVAPVGLPVTTQ